MDSNTKLYAKCPGCKRLTPKSRVLDVIGGCLIFFFCTRCREKWKVFERD